MADTPEQNPVRPEGSSTHAEESDKETSAVPPRVTAESHIPPSIHNARAAERKKKCRLEWGKFAIEALTLIVVAIYTVIAYHQWDEMRKATAAANTSADTAHESLIMANRPWLGVDGTITILEPLTVDKDGLHVDIGFRIKNFGPGIALHVGANEEIRNSHDDVRPDGTVDWGRFKDASDVSCKMADMDAKPVIPGENGTGPYIFPNNSHPYESHMTRKPSPDPMSSLDIIGCITYADQFKGIHHTRFCFMGQKGIKDTMALEGLAICPINESAD